MATAWLCEHGPHLSEDIRLALWDLVRLHGGCFQWTEQGIQLDLARVSPTLLAALTQAAQIKQEVATLPVKKRKAPEDGDREQKPAKHRKTAEGRRAQVK